MSHLRLIHPAKPKSPRPKQSRHDGYVFTAEENARLRAALKNARTLFGTWACLADAMQTSLGAVTAAAGGERLVSAALAVRLARALGKPLETLYRAPSDATQCPTCGARRVP